MRERILAIRLAEKISQKQDYAESLGIAAELKTRNSHNNDMKREEKGVPG